MEYSFIDDYADKKLLLKNDISKVNQFFIENNSKQIEKLFEFFKSNGTPLMLLNGFLGTGKSLVVEHFLTFLNTDVVVLRYNCYETTILDDILLAFFEELRVLADEGRITPPKTKSENFVQKISAYFHSINKPVVIVIDSFEEVLKENKGAVVDFLEHISKLGKAKTIIISRRFDYEDFDNRVNYEIVSVLAFEKNLYEKYLRSFDIKLIGPASDELYKYTRGYYFYVSMAVRIMMLRGLTLFDFLNGFTKSFLSYNDFILREALAFVDPVSGHLFRFLTIMRHPVSVKLLKTLNLYDERKIEFFLENMILSKDSEMIYLQDYYKEIAQNSIPANVAVKIHKSCVDLYNTQLPLKPFERDLLISRATMRAEIEYHRMFLPKKPVFVPKIQQQPQETEPQAQEPSECKKEIQSIKFIFESEESENEILTGIANSINEFLSFSEEQMREIERENNLSLVELVNLAKQEENNYNYKRCIMIYHRALTLEKDDNYSIFLPILNLKLAQNYKNLSDWFNALKYFECALKLYEKNSDREKVADIKLEIANIFYITFKRDKAKELLQEIIEQQNLSSDIYIKAFIALADLCEEDLNQAYRYYNRAVELAQDCDDKSLLASLYFKFAIANDDINQTKQAVIYYKKCLEIDKKFNPHLSSCYSNLGLIYEEAGSVDAAMKFYEESVKIDKEDKIFNSIYVPALKLAEYFRKSDPAKALEYYMMVKNNVYSKLKEENRKKIDARILSLKAQLGMEEVYENK